MPEGGSDLVWKYVSSFQYSKSKCDCSVGWRILWRTCLLRCTVILLELGALLLAGCSPEWYRENANNEVYGILDQKRQPLVSEERQELAFSIEPQPVSVDEVGVSGEREDFWGTPPPDPEEVTVDIEGLGEVTSEAASPADAATPEQQQIEKPVYFQ